MPDIALTIGDPTGIGPEITAKALQHIDEFPNVRMHIIGSLKALEMAASGLKIKLPHNAHVEYHAIEDEQPGAVSYHSLEKAVQMIAAHDAEALVTGPLSKQRLNAAGFSYKGHTEILEELTKRYFGLDDVKAEMLFVYNNFRLMLLTRHIPLRDITHALAKRDSVEKSFSILIDFLHRKMKINKPRLAVLGVNPHAGEIGGVEEEKVLKPLVEDLQKTGLAMCDGPLAADGFFRGFDLKNIKYDAIVATYHDQGLIPFKMLAGFEAVNMSIGLPFIRTSVGHGTAEDIAGKGIAREDSLMVALQTAIELM